jgi:anti-sigma factor RsiW
MMSETFTCRDHSALMSYLYGECTPAERRMIGAHLAICRACAEELVALGATREHLAMWTPPDAELGFRIVPDAPRSNVLRPARWWQQPMPAWAQVAAAVLIFATGVMLGAVREITQSADRGTGASATLRSNTTGGANPANGAPVTRAELVAVEQRLRSEMLQPHATAQNVVASPDGRLLERVRALIEESEQRQRRELALRSAELVRDFDAQRNVDLARIERTLGQMDGTTGVEVAQQRQMLNYLMRVSQRGQ